jgi:hypothetical protein
MNTTQGQEDSRRDTDPFIVAATHCTDCRTTMDGLRVFAGSTPIHRHLRGSIAQTVSCTIVIHHNTFIILSQCPNCHHTKFHTPAYEFADAEALLVRIQARQNRLYIPRPALEAPLRPAPQPIERPDKKINCANTRCFTKSNQTRTQGNRNCIGYLCGNCCRGARISASTANTVRQKCNVHHVDAVTPTIMGIPSQAVPARPPPSGTFTLTQPAPVLVNIPHPVPLPFANDIVQPPLTQSPPIDPKLLATDMALLQTAPASSGRGRQQLLAQPMGTHWRERHREAINVKEASKAMKTHRQELDDKKKRTCEVLIWFEVRNNHCGNGFT